MKLGTLRRSWVAALLALTAGTVLFFLVAPAIGYPLEFEQGWGIAQISVPIFAGYLATATQFATGTSADDGEQSPPLLPWLVFAPMALYVAATVILLIVFGVTNGEAAPIGTGMSLTLLSTMLTALLGLVTVTANIAIARIFRKE